MHVASLQQGVFTAFTFPHFQSLIGVDVSIPLMQRSETNGEEIFMISQKSIKH